MPPEIPDQLMLLESRPDQSRLESPKNPRAYQSGEDIQEWMKGIRAHPVLRGIVDPAETLFPQWILKVNLGARVCEISSLADALYFQRFFAIHPELPVPPAGLKGQHAALTTCQTDWEQAGKHFDAVHLNEVAVQEIEIAHFGHGVQTPFDTWNCESTFWFRWSFLSVEQNPNGKT